MTLTMLNGFNVNNDRYNASDTPPDNVSIEYYHQLVAILNKIDKNMRENREYTEEEHTEILRFFMVSNSKTDEEFKLKGKLAMLDTNAVQYFKAIRTNDEKLKEMALEMYKDELKELKDLLKLK